jgi:hypothetical protein
MLHNHDKPKETVESIRELKRSIYFWAIASGCWFSLPSPSGTPLVPATTIHLNNTISLRQSKGTDPLCIRPYFHLVANCKRRILSYKYLITHETPMQFNMRKSC